MAFEDNIEHRSKRVPWGGTTTEADYVELGENWSGAAFTMQFAAAPGGAVISAMTLNAASAGSQGINATYDPDYVDPETGAVVGATTIRPLIPETTLEGLSWGSTPTDQPLVLHYDLLVTPSGGQQLIYSYGTFTLYPGIGD
jgi:hypothetical protein